MSGAGRGRAGAHVCLTAASQKDGRGRAAPRQAHTALTASWAGPHGGPSAGLQQTQHSPGGAAPGLPAQQGTARGSRRSGLPEATSGSPETRPHRRSPRQPPSGPRSPSSIRRLLIGWTGFPQTTNGRAGRGGAEVPQGGKALLRREVRYLQGVARASAGAWKLVQNASGLLVFLADPITIKNNSPSLERMNFVRENGCSELRTGLSVIDIGCCTTALCLQSNSQRDRGFVIVF